MLITERILKDIIREEILQEKKKRKKDESKPHPREYGAPEGSPRAEKLDRAKANIASNDPKRKQAGWKSRKRMEDKLQPDTKTETVYIDEDELRALVREALSKKTKATLRKKAEKRGLTPGSVEAEYKKGLAAWGTSGSRPGISQHAWAMARVNSATPSKDWAVVKKSKAKKNK